MRLSVGKGTSQRFGSKYFGMPEHPVADVQSLVVEREDAVLRVTLNRPARANALDRATIDAFSAVLERRSLFDGIRALVIRGEGRNFCGGFDLSDIASLSDGDIVLRFLQIESLLQRLYHAPYLTIACAQGNAIGAGADIFAACDYRLAAAGARFRMPGWQFGIALGTRRLCDRVGPRIARDLLTTSRTLTADAALQCSFATRVVEPESWSPLVETIVHDSQKITSDTLMGLHVLTVPDHRDADMAALVASALRPPGLKRRLLAYIANAGPSAPPNPQT